jgi:hypothetical protein
MEHDLTVEYTNMDDGIWLNCRDCDFSINIGFFPEVVVIKEIQNIHHSHPSIIITMKDGVLRMREDVC